VSFVLCLIYLAFLPFHAWALAVLVGLSALTVMLLGRPGDAVTAGITTAVIMVVAAVSPQHAWEQPILRLADTVIGVAVGALARLDRPTGEKAPTESQNRFTRTVHGPCSPAASLRKLATPAIARSAGPSRAARRE
jgi:hypothetical protein